MLFIVHKSLLFFPGNDSRDAKMKKSVSAGYTTELLTLLVHYTENADFLQTHGQTLLALTESGIDSLPNKLGFLAELLFEYFYAALSVSKHQMNGIMQPFPMYTMYQM